MSWRTNKDWWKAPVLQGPENDYGEYDYLAEELPEDYSRWEFSNTAWKCDCCGKYHHLNLCSKSHFYCYDGWDSMDYTDCWVCVVKSKVRMFFRKIHRKFKVLKEAWTTYNQIHRHVDWKTVYGIYNKSIK